MGVNVHDISAGTGDAAVISGDAVVDVGAPGAGGAAGPAIVGIGLVTITGSGSILGPQI